MTFAAFTASPNRVIIDGQSLNLLSDTGSLWPARAFVGGGVPFNNVSIGSTAWTHLIVTASQRVYPLFARARNVVFIVGIGGQSDLIDESETGQAIYDELVAYVQAAETAATTAGATLRTIGVTIPPSTAITGGRETQRNWANLFITEDAQGVFDAVCDVTSVVTDASDPLQLYDGTHMASASHAGVAALIGPEAKALYIG